MCGRVCTMAGEEQPDVKSMAVDTVGAGYCTIEPVAANSTQAVCV